MKFINYFRKKNISLFLFFFINIIFGIKYLSRIASFYPIVLLFFVVIYCYIFFRNKTIILFLKKLKFSIYILLFFYIIFSFLLFYLIPKETLNVDRWSVISSFWDNYFSDKYVYFAKSLDGNYPGPMPFYFVLALPFYLIGELGLYSLLGIIIFILLLKNNFRNNDSSSVIFLAIAFSLFYIWEVSTRSNIFFNASLILICIYFYFKKYIPNLKNDIIFGLVFGLVLSTRNVLVIPLIVAILYSLKIKKINFKHLVLMGIFSVISFIFTFLPFVWNHVEDFKTMNPFIIQSSFLMPFKFTIFFIGLSFASVYFCKTKSDVYFYSGIILFLTILFYFAYTILKTDFNEVFINSKADISYFIFCLPFVLFYYVTETNLEK